MGGDEGARRLEQFRIRAKDFNVDTDGRDDDRLDGARDVTHGHVTNVSARGQEDCVDAVSFEYLCLRVDLLPPLYLHKSSGKVVLERSEVGKSCLPNYATSFAEGVKKCTRHLLSGTLTFEKYRLHEPIKPVRGKRAAILRRPAFQAG
jgi:hypothetical protein